MGVWVQIGDSQECVFDGLVRQRRADAESGMLERLFGHG